jgi:acylphosphatase
MAQSNPTQSFHMIFTGRVQGVGFRFTAQRFANELGLAGWVRNMPDEASVELCAQGDALAIGKFIERLKQHFSIHDVRSSEVPVSGALTSFEIRY